MTPRSLIVWDLDRTLGVFDALGRVRDPDVPVTVALRPGIEAALADLSAEGFVHVVLTLAAPAYADLALRGTGLRGHFAEVAGAGQRPKGDADGIARAFGIPEDEMPHRMIFIGDHPWNDAPADPRVVFHIEPLALRRRAEPLAALILELRRRGKESLRRGFDALIAAPRSGDHPAAVDLPGVGALLLAPRVDECPVIIFAGDPAAEDAGTPITFTPADLGLRR